MIELKSRSRAKEVSVLADGIHYRKNQLSELVFPPGVILKVDAVFYS